MENEARATLKIALAMLQKGLDNLTVMNLTGLEEKDLEQIRH